MVADRLGRVPAALHYMCMAVSADLLALLLCPESRAPLKYLAAGVRGPDETLFCPTSRLVYPVRGGIPVMLVDEAERVDEGEAERLAAAATTP